MHVAGTPLLSFQEVRCARCGRAPVAFGAVRALSQRPPRCVARVDAVRAARVWTLPPCAQALGGRAPGVCAPAAALRGIALAQGGALPARTPCFWPAPGAAAHAASCAAPYMVPLSLDDINLSLLASAAARDAAAAVWAAASHAAASPVPSAPRDDGVLQALAASPVVSVEAVEARQPRALSLRPASSSPVRSARDAAAAPPPPPAALPGRSTAVAAPEARATAAAAAAAAAAASSLPLRRALAPAPRAASPCGGVGGAAGTPSASACAGQRRAPAATVCDAEAFGSGCGAASGDEAFALALQAADAADDAAEDAAGAAAAAALVMSCMFEEFVLPARDVLHAGERVAGKATVAKATEL